MDKEQLRKEFRDYCKGWPSDTVQDHFFDWFFSKLEEKEKEITQTLNRQFKKRFSELKVELNEVKTLRDRIKFLQGEKMKKPFDDLKRAIEKMKSDNKKKDELLKAADEVIELAKREVFGGPDRIFWKTYSTYKQLKHGTDTD